MPDYRIVAKIKGEGESVIIPCEGNMCFKSCIKNLEIEATAALLLNIPEQSVLSASQKGSCSGCKPGNKPLGPNP